MKTITKTIEVYEFNELSEEAKQKAISDFNEVIDYPFLTDDLREYIHEELTEKGFIYDKITPLYSLSHSQGDGLMFESTVSKDGSTYTIKHSGRYYHERSTNITGEDGQGNEIDTKDFEENVYIPICEAVARRGYDFIEYTMSEEYMQETCDANEYTFTKKGVMESE